MKGNPFFLDEEGENWVLDTWKNMSLEQKCGQVFCPMGFNGEEETLKHFTQDIQVGGLMYRADSAENIQDIYSNVVSFEAIRNMCFSLLSILFVCLYNGQHGSKKKWIYYWAYPLHILIFAILRC